MSAEAFYLMQKSEKAVSDCDMAIAQMNRTKTLSAVVLAMQVHVDSLVRHFPQVRSAVQRLERAAVRQAERLVGIQLKALAEVKDRNAFDALLGQFRREWEVLRGHLPAVYRQATSQAAKLRPVFKADSQD